MATVDEIHTRWLALPASPTRCGSVVGITRRLGAERHEALQRAEVSAQLGLEGDRWLQGPRQRSRQVSLVSVRTLAALTPISPAWIRCGDNLLVDYSLLEEGLPTGAELLIGGLHLRVSETPHLGCNRFAHRFGEAARTWVNAAAYRHLRLRGIYCEVLQGGLVQTGMPVRRLGALGP